MNARQQLERLLALRERRQRKAEAALAEQRRQCRAEAEHIARLDAERATQCQDFDRREREWFDATQGAPLSAQALEQARQAIDSHYHHQAELDAQRQTADREHQRQLAECDRRASEWARRVRSRQALETLLERKRSDQRRVDEGRAELELEDIAPPSTRGGR